MDNFGPKYIHLRMRLLQHAMLSKNTVHFNYWMRHHDRLTRLVRSIHG